MAKVDFKKSDFIQEGRWHIGEEYFDSLTTIGKQCVAIATRRFLYCDHQNGSVHKMARKIMVALNEDSMLEFEAEDECDKDSCACDDDERRPG